MKFPIIYIYIYIHIYITGNFNNDYLYHVDVCHYLGHVLKASLRLLGRPFIMPI